MNLPCLASLIIDSGQRALHYQSIRSEVPKQEDAGLARKELTLFTEKAAYFMGIRTAGKGYLKMKPPGSRRVRGVQNPRLKRYRGEDGTDGKDDVSREKN